VRYENTGYGRNRRRVKKPDTTLKTRREKKWLIFVTLAASRFFRWCKDMEDSIAGQNSGGSCTMGEEHLPPLGKSPFQCRKHVFDFSA
jgi:hypothetical protein